MTLKSGIAAALALSTTACSAIPETTAAWSAPTLGGRQPIVIAHRGASGELPEHTLPAYERALIQGADCIEPDLVMTKDGVLIDRHDIYLSTTTDIASRPEFASRKRLATDKDHAGREDWFASDFTLAEIRTLRARQPFDTRSKVFDGLYAIPTFEEVIDLALSRTTITGAQVCIYPEAKAPALHASLGFDMAGEILRILEKKGLSKKGSPVFIQTFEPEFAKQMSVRTQLPVVMLAGDNSALSQAMEMKGAPFWDGLGVTHRMLFNDSGASSGLVEAAHAAGIQVHVWTYRDDAPFGDETIEVSMEKALRLGVDGVFSDFPATARRVVREMTPGRFGAPD
jgi:glycerophosphoryl diester phosphodiesterase